MRLSSARAFRICRLAACSILLFTPCFADRVVTEVAGNADFSRYKTYNWLQTRLLEKSGPLEDAPAFSTLVKSAVNHELAKLGLREVPEGGDLGIIATGFNSPVPQMEAISAMNPLDPFSATQVFATGLYNKEGTLILNLVDSRTSRIVWTGMVPDALDKKAKISKAAANLFKKYPKR